MLMVCFQNVRLALSAGRLFTLLSLNIFIRAENYVLTIAEDII